MNDNDLPYHLREDARPLGRCSHCQRKTWAVDEIGRRCKMPQPDGQPCAGVLISRVAEEDA